MAILWAALLLSLLQGVVLITVALAIFRRELGGEAGIANRLFAVWWWMASGIVLLRAAIDVVQGAWGPHLALQVTYVHVLILMVTAGTWALSSYLAFIFTGRRRAWLPLGVAYGLLLVAMFFVVAYAQPIGLQMGQWQMELEYENDLSGIAAVQVLIVLLFLPPLLGALAYASLIFRIQACPQRFRIGTVGGALALWFGSTILAVLLGWNQLDAWILIGRLIGLAATLLVLMAYRPPRWLARRLGEAE